MAYNGNNILVLRDGTAIAGVKSHEIQTSAGTIEISSATQQDWREYIADRKEWSLNVNYLVLAAANMTDLLSVGTAYTIAITDRAGTVTVSGSAILENCKQTYQRGNLVQGTFQFRGSGALSNSTSE